MNIKQNDKLVALMKQVGAVDEKVLQEGLKKAYYTGTPIISDEQYDELFGDKDYVGYTPDQTGPWQVLKHKIAMGSLNKIKTWKDAQNWIAKRDVLWQPKLDGLSIELVYEHGILTHAILRGGGDVGEDILKNAKKFQYVPAKLETLMPYISIRGEVVISQSSFKKLLDITKESYSNRRNCVPGICRRYDSKYSEFLSFWAYDIVEINEYQESKIYTSELEKLTTLYTYGFKIPFSYPKLTEKQYVDYGDIRDTAEEFQMDGLVIKTLNQSGQIALKFEPKGAFTTVTDYTWEVGSTGKLVPIIWFEPVTVTGTKLQKASGASLRNIRNLDAPIASVVEVRKMNDVIPKVTRTLAKSELELEIPTRCPVCGSILEEKGADLYCINPNCQVKLENKCTAVYWTFYLKGVTDSWVKQLIKQNKIHCPADVLKVQPNDIANLDGYSLNKANKIIDNMISESKKMLESNDIERLLHMLPIPTIAGKAYTKLAEDLLDIETFYDLLKFDKLLDFKSVVGNAKGQKVNEYLKENKSQIIELIDTLRALSDTKLVETC